MLPEFDPCEPVPRPAGRRAVPHSRPQHVRRLTVASIIFGVVVLALCWLLGQLILHDLSERFISRTLAQAQQEAESFAQMTSDDRILGEGQQQPSIRTAPGGAIDPDVILGPLAPKIFDTQGNAVDAMRPLAKEPEHGDSVKMQPSQLRPGIMVTQGQEWQFKVNGELIGRDVVHSIDIRYRGGFQHIDFRKIEGRLIPRSVMEDPKTLIERVPIERPPSSRQVLVSWPSTLNGEPVQLSAAVDGEYLDKGVRELRKRIIPKLLAGGMVLVLLLGLGYAYVLQLITEARRLEAEAAEADMLAQVGMLAAGLAHEIRNPLNAVNMNLQLLEEDLTEVPLARAVGGMAGSPAGAAPLLRTTQKEIGRLSALVTDFLSYARPTAPQRAAAVLDVLVKDCVELFRPAAEGAGVRIEMHLGAGSDPILLDDGMIKQAVMNVLVNAIQACPSPGGRVTVTTRRAGRSVQVEITDNGPGLPDDVEQIFQAFRSTKKGGTGLGLPISRALVERHCGTLTARNVDHGGAGFTISLPAERA